MNTLSLSKKIGLTISMVLLFFVVLAVVMFIAMSKISSSFDGFSQSVTEGNDASDTTVAALEMRSNIAEYISGRKESNVSTHRAMYAELSSNLAAAVRDAEDPKSRKALEGAQSLLKGYDEAFNSIVELRAKEAKLIAETIRPGSAEIKQLLKDMLSADQAKGDIAAAFASSTALQAMFEAESSVNRIILSFNEEDIKAAQSHAALLGTKLAALQSDYEMNVEFDESLADASKEQGLAKCLELNMSFSEGIVALASTLRRIKEIDERDLMPVGPRFATQMGEVRAAASSRQTELKADVEQLQSTVNTLVVAIGLIGLACGAGVSVFIVRGITRSIDVIVSQLESNASETYQASSQVSSNSESLARDSSDQAAAIEETSSSLEEVNAMTEKNAENAESAKSLAREARVAAESGSESMKDMIVAMQEIKDSSDNIANIIKTIDEIAFQTNILALNAAVEAARAGESGAGFAVVADEVRSLAHRSAEAASVTAEKIANSVQKSVRGVELNQRVAQNLQTIVQRTQQMDELVAQISDASSEQNRGVSLIQRSIAQMDSVTQRNAAGAEETASSARVLLQQSNSLQDAIADLVRVVNGGGSRHQGAPSSSRRPTEFASSGFDGRAEVEFEAPRRGKKPGKVAASADGHSVDLWEN